MKKPWKEKRRKASGRGWYYYVRWYDYIIKDGKKKYVQRSKTLRTKAEQEHFYHILYQRLNSDVYTSATNLSWREAVGKFLLKYDIEGESKSAREDANRSVKVFAEICGELNTKEIGQEHINAFKLELQDMHKSRHTINKYLSRFRTFLNWLKKNKYHEGGLEIKLLKTSKVIVSIPTNKQINKLLKSCPDKEWHMRVLLSLVLGFRAGDIDHLKTSDFNLKNMSIKIVEKKTGTITWYPLPDVVKPLLRAYLKARKGYIFTTLSRSTLDKQWRKFRPRTLTRQDLRKTNKTLLQTVGNVGSIQSLLHKDLRVTQEYYTDNQLVLRWKVNQLPIKQWLK